MLRNGLEPWHLLIVAVIFILLFGAKRLPDTARSVGKSLRILKSETAAMKSETEVAKSGPTAAPSEAGTGRKEGFEETRGEA
ncbi:Sec-independent protein translocase subunit TatA [Streptomyces sp. KL116D]|uniref:Sec-independent protein translocase subunit TatA n=1 Tax=Streptomyces sp. KL116D TaxID=3045152 RepID=UPI0035581DE8